MTRRIFLDIEFTNLPWTGHSHPLWIGLADEDGNEWIAISAEVPVDETTSEFVRSVVLPRIPDEEPRLSQRELATRVREFCGPVTEFWCWCPSVEDLAEGFGLGASASEMHARYWDWDSSCFGGSWNRGRRLGQRTPTTWPIERGLLGCGCQPMNYHTIPVTTQCGTVEFFNSHSTTLETA